jgi:hypothetical protein
MRHVLRNTWKNFLLMLKILCQGTLQEDHLLWMIQDPDFENDDVYDRVRELLGYERPSAAFGRALAEHRPQVASRILQPKAD